MQNFNDINVFATIKILIRIDTTMERQFNVIFCTYNFIYFTRFENYKSSTKRIKTIVHSRTKKDIFLHRVKCFEKNVYYIL
jgi:hypothetical protein